MDTVYEKGTIKVVWIEKSIETIYSKMFSSKKEAREFAAGKSDFLIFQLVSQDRMKEFSWQILPYGNFELYTKLMRRYKKAGRNIIDILAKAL